MNKTEIESERGVGNKKKGNVKEGIRVEVWSFVVANSVRWKVEGSCERFGLSIKKLK